MTLLLASVTGPEEAEIAVGGRADIIDLKDSVRGAFGAVRPELVRATVAAVAGRRPVSAVTGELPMEPRAVVAAALAMAEAGAAYAKIGLYPAPGREACIRALAGVARRTRLVGVMFADEGADEGLLPLMAQSGFAGAMLDTAHKGGRRLLDHMDIAALGPFVAAAQAHGLMAGLAGSLEPPDIPRLLLLAPDVLGFRGALCASHDRTAQIDPAAMDIVRALIPPPAVRFPSLAGVELLAARGYSHDAGKSDTADRVFIRDFVLPARVGAYAHEHDRSQNVRFAVDVKVRRPGRAAEDMRDVLSYDVITDGIRMIVAHEHVPLLETLAERIAALVLNHPRALRVTVRIEKLDIGPGGVGIEITRERQAAMAHVRQLYPAAGREIGTGE